MFTIQSMITGTASHAPRVTPVVCSLLVTLVILSIGMTRICCSMSGYQTFWKKIQYLQIISLYSWYLFAHFDVVECLPFYHCRMATLAILFLPTGRLKTYFAYLGIAGAICALCYPVFDPYPFPHLTILSYVIGHMALLINCLIYLYQNEASIQLSFKNILQMTFLMNVVIGVVDLIFQANYGFLRETPILASKNGMFNLLIVSLVISILMTLIQGIMSREIERLTVRV
ncbi:TIGR02206 family membrane protein [Streptococcus thoraltensis]|uniref:YwaF family protein n=1 Tax=Streptococcus thoraltensis TaxID=55085 RepID=UPI001F560EB7|nr:TIGR02206 family membrane protein [Streptococcus thoraltensis]